DREHAPLVDALATFERNELPSRFEQWLTVAQPVAPEWLLVDVQSSKSDGGAAFARQDDGSYLVSGKNADHDIYTLVVHTKRAGITSVRVEALADPSLPKSGPGRAANGNFALSDFQLWAAASDDDGPGAPVKLVRPRASFEQATLPVAAAIDDNKTSA